MNNNDLLNDINKIHTTEMGVSRIKNNLGLDTGDVVNWCVERIKRADDIVRKGKNYYVTVDNCVITVNAHSFTIITAHKKKVSQPPL